MKLYLHYGDLSEAETVNNIIYNIRPDEVYNLGAQSHVRVSFDVPEYTTNVVATGVTRMLESIRRAGNDVRFYQASSSEMFGSTAPPQSETSPFAPARRTHAPNCMLTGSPVTIARVTAFSHATAYCSTMNRPGGGRPS